MKAIDGEGYSEGYSVLDVIANPVSLYPLNFLARRQFPRLPSKTLLLLLLVVVASLEGVVYEEDTAALVNSQLSPSLRIQRCDGLNVTQQHLSLSLLVCWHSRRSHLPRLMHLC